MNVAVASLDNVFSALADPTRRAMIVELGRKESISVSELARPFDMTLPAIMKHLAVLDDAGLITRTKSGRVVACRLNAGPMKPAVAWLNKYEKFWSGALDRLAAFVEDEDE